MVSIANAISPGVYSTLTDLSFFVSSATGTGAIMVVFSEKGEDRVMQRVVSQEDLKLRFGRRLIKYGQGMLNAGQFVANSGNLHLMRVTLEDAKYASMVAKLIQVDKTVYVGSVALFPPVLPPAPGTSYLINGVGTGEFAGHDFQVATYLNSQYSFDVIDVGTWVKVTTPLTWLLRSATGYSASLNNIKGMTTVPPTVAAPTIPGVYATVNINGITIPAFTIGTPGNALNIEFVKPAPSTSLALSIISSTDITVTLGTNAAGDIISTKEDVVNILNTTPGYGVGPSQKLGTAVVSTGSVTEIASVSGGVNEIPLNSGKYPKFFTGGLNDVVTALATGDKFIISGANKASGVWEGHDNEIAEWDGTNSLWTFEVPEFWDWVVLQSNSLITQYNGVTWAVRASNPGMTAKIKLVKATGTIESKDELNVQVQSSGSLFGIYGKGRGAWYNDVFIQFSPMITPDTIDKANKVVASIYFNNREISDLTQIESYPVSLKSKATDVTGESSVIDHVVNTYSRDLQIVLNSIELENPVLTNELKRIEEVQEFGNRGASLADIFVSDELKTDYPNVYKLFGGSDGAQMFNEGGTIDYGAAKVISALLDGYTGIFDESILNPETLDASLIYDANYPFSVKAAISQLAQQRGDSGAVIDMLKNLTPKASIDSRISKFTFNHYSTWLFENVTQVFNSDDGKFIEVTPSYHLASAIPINDAQRNVWSAVVINNAVLSGIEKLTFNPNKSQRDDLYLNQINSIVNLNGQTTIWTQLTSQKRASKLQDISSVRLYFLIDKTLKRFANGLLPSSNDAITWSNAADRVGEFLSTIKADRGLESYTVTAGATEFELRNKTFHINVEFVPVGQTEKIFLNYTVK